MPLASFEILETPDTVKQAFARGVIDPSPGDVRVRSWLSSCVAEFAASQLNLEQMMEQNLLTEIDSLPGPMDLEYGRVHRRRRGPTANAKVRPMSALKCWRLICAQRWRQILLKAPLGQSSHPSRLA